MKKIRIFILLLSIIVSFISWKYYLSPVVSSLPQPTGHYQVGTISYDINQNGHAFTIRCWYPSNQVDPKNYPYGNLEQNNHLINHFAKESHLPLFLLSQAFNLDSISKPKLSLSSEKSSYPVIIFIPGSDATYDHYDALISNIVSHGYIVIGFNTMPLNPIAFGNGLFVPCVNKPIMPSKNAIQSAKNYHDITMINIDATLANFDEILTWIHHMNKDENSLWHQHINFEKIYIMGHSFGGFASVVIAQNNPKKIAACISLDGRLQEKHMESFKIPILFLLTDTSSPLFSHKEVVKDIESLCPSKSCIRILPQSGHMNFCDLAFLKWHRLFGPNFNHGCPALYGSADPYHTLQNISQNILEFFNAH